MRVYWTAKALLRLQQIHDRIAFDQPLNAQRFVDRLTRKAELIEQSPSVGRVVPKYQREDIREIFEQDYRIVYLIRPDRIDILTVRRGARLVPARIHDL